MSNIEIRIPNTWDNIQRQVVIETLAYCNGKKSATAEALGVDVRTIRNYIKKYKLEGIECQLQEQKLSSEQF